MNRLPRLKGREVVRVLQKIGFQVTRTRGSHVFLKHRMGGQRLCRCMLVKQSARDY